MGKINKVLFIGSKNLGLNCLKAIHSIAKDSIIGVLTIDDSLDQRSVLQSYTEFCKENNIKLSIARNKTESEQFITQEKPELCLVIGWYWLFTKAILETVPYGFIGLHNSLLPKYRGGSPLVWNIINGEKTIGFSIFSFTEGMDDGMIWHQYKYNPGPNADIDDILQHLEGAAAEVLRTIYISLLNGDLMPNEQDHKLASYCAGRIPEDGLINWNKSAAEIFNFIRAQAFPYPGAYTFYKKEKLTIWKAAIDERQFYGTPGQVAAINSEGLLVVCGDNKCIVLKDIELGLKKGKSYEIIKSIQARFHSES